MKVGSDHSSKTFYPTATDIEIGDETWEWWDLPGLMDTRSFIFRLCIGFFLKTAVEGSKNSELKFLYVKSSIELFEMNSYCRLVELFGNMFNWNNN